MKDSRPVNLDLFKFHFPLPALVSIGHRVSGVVLFLGMPFVLWALHQSLDSSNGFAAVLWTLSLPVVRFVLWLFIAALLYHFCAGIKHLLMDMGFGETLAGARVGSVVTLICFSTLVLIAGVWLW